MFLSRLPWKKLFIFQDNHLDDSDKKYISTGSFKERSFSSCWLPSFAHTYKDVEKTLIVYNTVFDLIMCKKIYENKLESLLEGRMVEPVFRKA